MTSSVEQKIFIFNGQIDPFFYRYVSRGLLGDTSLPLGHKDLLLHFLLLTL